MRIMADGAGDADVGVIRQCRRNNVGGRTFDHSQPDGT